MKEKNQAPKQRFPDISWPLAVVLYSLFLGFLVTSNGMTGWDDFMQISHANWLLGEFGFQPQVKAPAWYMYAPLWEITMGLVTKYVFFWLHDDVWVRHAATFALLPIGLTMMVSMYRKMGISFWGAFLSVAGILGYTRLIGHATFNVKDFPAAIVFFVCTIGTWQALVSFEKNTFSLRRLFTIGIIASLPYLVRSPLLTLLPLALISLFFYIVRQRKELTLLQALLVFFVPVVTSLLFIVAVSPALWPVGAAGIQDAAIRFSDYPWRGAVRLFGFEYQSNTLPFWYSIAWIPLGIEPGAFFACITGFVLLARKRCLPNAKTTRWGFGQFCVHVGYVDWLALVTFVSFAATMTVRPTLYDEERHILFLFLLFYALGFLGLEWLHSRTKKIMAIVILLLACSNLWHWGIYAYIYRSPLLSSSFHSYDFSGDYWDACSTKAGKVLSALPERKNLPVKFRHGAGRTSTQNIFDRLNNGFFTRNENSPKIKIRNPMKGEKFWYLLGIRETMGMVNPSTLEAKKIEKIWEDKLPTGETACAIYVVTPR